MNKVKSLILAILVSFGVFFATFFYYQVKERDITEAIVIKNSNPTFTKDTICLLYTSPSPRDVEETRMPSSA